MNAEIKRKNALIRKLQQKQEEYFKLEKELKKLERQIKKLEEQIAEEFKSDKVEENKTKNTTKKQPKVLQTI